MTVSDDRRDLVDGAGARGVDVLDLGDERAVDVGLVGTKAAALARADRAGLPVLPGFVVTTGAAASIDDRGPVRDAWEALSERGAHAVVVRSSSPVEDRAETSMAGRFESVVGVHGWSEFLAAIATVRESATTVARDDWIDPASVPMAVLVQPVLDTRVGGVLFGVDPVTGRSDRRVIAVAPGMPEDLVSGAVSGSRYEVGARGRRYAYDAGESGVRLRRGVRRALVDLADRCEARFGSPQDIEWGLDASGALWLLQSRPVTTAVNGVPAGPVLGPGPVAETFPDPLARLEQDLWAEPLRVALERVFGILGVVSPRHLRRSPVLVTVGGRVAIDLDLFESTGKVPWWALGRRGRALRAAWRIGRLRAALVGLGTDVVAHADDALLAVPAPAELTDRQIVASLERLRDALVSLHAHEMLVGLVLHPDDSRLTASSVALRVLAQARHDQVAEADIPMRFPIVLSLAAPSVGETTLPADVAVPDWTPGEQDVAAVTREALRLRVRWVHEAGARLAWELAGRLAARGVLDEPAQIRDLGVDDLEMTVRGLAVTVADQLRREEPREAPLPARFRLSDTGRPVAVVDRHPHQGTGAGGGRGSGPVHLDADDVPDGVVLVVRTLDARLAPVLPRLHGLVAETGSVLAHLAILARESGVPVVVGMEGATGSLAEGTVVTVDGTTGAVTAATDADGGRGR